MFLIFTVVILIAAAIILFVRRQTRPPLLEDQTPKYLEGENLRSLFAPDEEELRARDREQQKLLAEHDVEEREKEHHKKLASFEEFRQTWRESPDRSNTIELLFRASQTDSGETYAATVDEILHKRTETLSNEDLAQLIESHFWLLPRSERTPSVTFTINRELTALRGGSSVRSEEADQKS